MAGDQDGERYRLTLIAQCNALSKIMPFLFERIDSQIPDAIKCLALMDDGKPKF